MPKPEYSPDKEGDSPEKDKMIGGAGFSLESIEDKELKEFAQRKFGSSIEQMTPQEIVLKSLEMQRNQEKMHSLQDNELGVLRKKIEQLAAGRTSSGLDKSQNQPPGDRKDDLPITSLEEIDSKLSKIDELSEQLAKLPGTTKEIETMKTQMETMLNNMKNSMGRMQRFDSLAAIRERRIIADLIEEDLGILKKEYAKEKDGEQKAIAEVSKILPYLDDNPEKNPLGVRTKSFVDLAWGDDHPVLFARRVLFPEKAQSKPSPSEGAGKSSIPGEETSDPAEKIYLKSLVDLTNESYIEGVTK